MKRKYYTFGCTHLPMLRTDFSGEEKSIITNFPRTYVSNTSRGAGWIVRGKQRLDVIPVLLFTDVGQDGQAIAESDEARALFERVFEESEYDVVVCNVSAFVHTYRTNFVDKYEDNPNVVVFTRKDESRHIIVPKVAMTNSPSMLHRHPNENEPYILYLRRDGVDSMTRVVLNNIIDHCPEILRSLGACHLCVDEMCITKCLKFASNPLGETWSNLPIPKYRTVWENIVPAFNYELMMEDAKKYGPIHIGDTEWVFVKPTVMCHDRDNDLATPEQFLSLAITNTKFGTRYITNNIASFGHASKLGHITRKFRREECSGCQIVDGCSLKKRPDRCGGGLNFEELKDYMAAPYVGMVFQPTLEEYMAWTHMCVNRKIEVYGYVDGNSERISRNYYWATMPSLQKMFDVMCHRKNAKYGYLRAWIAKEDVHAIDPITPYKPGYDPSKIGDPEYNLTYGVHNHQRLICYHLKKHTDRIRVSFIGDEFPGVPSHWTENVREHMKIVYGWIFSSQHLYLYRDSVRVASSLPWWAVSLELVDQRTTEITDFNQISCTIHTLRQYPNGLTPRKESHRVANLVGMQRRFLKWPRTPTTEMREKYSKTSTGTWATCFGDGEESG